MSYQKLIHDYLAGELSSEEEKKLFDGLSRHPEWREEMQLQRHMERAMEQDLHSVTVPPHTTGAVFASLGFRRPAKWPRRATWWTSSAVPVRTMILSGMAGMALLATSAYFLLPSHDVATVVVPSVRITMTPHAIAQSVTSASKEVLPGTRGNERVAGRRIQSSTISSPLVVRRSTIAAIQNQKPAVIANLDSSIEPVPPSMPNEPLRYYSDIGNLYSVHYLTPRKIVGVSYNGQIFVSNDSGHTWAPKQSGVSTDLYGVHFYDMTHGVAVGARGTILLTSDAGETWRTVASGMTTTLSTVRFVTKDTVYICGDNGAMLRSTTGGASWDVEHTGIHANLFRMMFGSGSSPRRVDVFGANDTHIATTDGGETWNTIK